jgi:hypothetical protein
MKILICVIIYTAILSFSCAGTNKHLRKSKKSDTENIVPKIEEKQITEPAIKIKEVEEKLVPFDEKLPDPHSYFVIIGSFRNPDNAKKYQGQIVKRDSVQRYLKMKPDYIESLLCQQMQLNLPERM